MTMTVSRDKMHPVSVCAWFLNRKSNLLFSGSSNKQSIASVKALQYQLGLCQYLWKHCEQQIKQATEVSDNEMGLFQVRGVPTIKEKVQICSGYFGKMDQLMTFPWNMNNDEYLSTTTMWLKKLLFLCVEHGLIKLLSREKISIQCDNQVESSDHEINFGKKVSRTWDPTISYQNNMQASHQWKTTKYNSTLAPVCDNYLRRWK